MTKPRRHLKICAAPTTECWQPVIVHCSQAAIARGASLADAPKTVLPAVRDFSFEADPFGIVHEGLFTVFVEAYDYRVKRGYISYVQYDAAWQPVRRGVALKEPFHLSYPVVFHHDGAIYMLPEAHRSGRLTLYRAVQFPDRWEKVAVLMDVPAIDASLLQHEGSWWMFYALPGPNGRALRELHVARADALTGPWVVHPANPVRQCIDSARPGGTPFVMEGKLHLPVQQCGAGYGAALQILRIDTLSMDAFAATPVRALTAEGIYPGYGDGLHTLSGVGEVSLIDLKRIVRSRRRWLINVERRLRRWLRIA